jgi:hypothetical protein
MVGDGFVAECSPIQVACLPISAGSKDIPKSIYTFNDPAYFIQSGDK